MDMLSADSLHRFFRADEGRVSLFCCIREAIGAFGDSNEQMGKSQISFGTRRKFAWVWMPVHTGKGRPEGCLVLTLSLRRKADSLRIAEAVEPYPGRWTTHIIISDARDIDDEVRGLIEEAYLLSK
ncbi:DUF5655 domain-containing protein [Youngiibacter fragilis]|uniref:DUF5655 domain-containing protein n=1 Tax=Youngiibacter fragilis 232.1 TaxID=994573 RepID=V7HZ08_9CLOT|nr:DUF5655 domain-containing protein [Youngiibacter fragilis]ETA79205.1 hypothetical protein T472_0218565 [Youngiibacter fragilis 232.1]